MTKKNKGLLESTRIAPYTGKSSHSPRQFNSLGSKTFNSSLKLLALLIN